jgi:hypothetical protein
VQSIGLNILLLLKRWWKILRKEDKREDVVVWNIQVPKTLDDMVEEVTRKEFMTKAEFIRQSVREKLSSVQNRGK